VGGYRAASITNVSTQLDIISGYYPRGAQTSEVKVEKSEPRGVGVDGRVRRHLNMHLLHRLLLLLGSQILLLR
jgi:hypothetical protein